LTDITFANPGNAVMPDKAIIHDDDTFRVQWSSLNSSNQDVPEFADRLVVYSIPEGCPGSDDVDHDIVFDSDVDGAIAGSRRPPRA
jgi:hypothetical protein